MGNETQKWFAYEMNMKFVVEIVKNLRSVDGTNFGLIFWYFIENDDLLFFFFFVISSFFPFDEK